MHSKMTSLFRCLLASDLPSVLFQRYVIKNVIEINHGVIRSMYNRLKTAQPDTDTKLISLRSVSISIDLYVSDMLSAFDVPIWLSRPIIIEINFTSQHIANVHQILHEKRKLTKTSTLKNHF